MTLTRNDHPETAPSGAIEEIRSRHPSMLRKISVETSVVDIAKQHPLKAH